MAGFGAEFRERTAGFEWFWEGFRAERRGLQASGAAGHVLYPELVALFRCIHPGTHGQDRRYAVRHVLKENSDAT